MVQETDWVAATEAGQERLREWAAAKVDSRGRSEKTTENSAKKTFFNEKERFLPTIDDFIVA